MTLDEFEALNGASGRYELIRGELYEVPPMGMRHGEIGSEFHWRLAAWVSQRRLGRVYISDTCFILAHGQPAVIVMPDVAFVRADRLPPADQRDRYAPFAPDLAVDWEVIEADPPHKLVQTFRMLMDEDMAAEGFTRLTYEISERGGLSRLTVVHELEGAPRLASLMAGEWEDQGAGGGWSFVLSGLKTLLETGDSLVH